MTEKPDFQFKGKYIIKADIRLLTALHIGGTEEGFDIGGIDNPVIKDQMTGVPYIPGSSLKGKMRSLLEWAYDLVKDEIKMKEGKPTAGPTAKANHPIGVVFGVSADISGKTDIYPGPTRLTVLDAWPDGFCDENGVRKERERWDEDTTIKSWENLMGERIYTEIKTENTIDRITSAANPRSMERVPANSVFKAEFIYDVYEEEDFDRLKVLFEGMQLLEDSTLGGGGSRGSGRILFENITIEAKHKSSYLGKNDIKELREPKLNDYQRPKDFVDNFDNLWGNDE